MGSKERRQREKEGTRQRILDAARELFVEHGYDAVTMRKLAERIEYSPTAIYVHFADKAALMRELSICDFQAFAEAFQTAPPHPDPACRLQQLGRTLVRFAQEHKNQYRLLFMTERPAPTEDGPDAEQMAAKPEQDAYTLLMMAVASARDAGIVHPDWDLDTVAQTFWGSLHGLVALHLVMPTPRGRVTLKPLLPLSDTAMALLLAAFRHAPSELPPCPTDP
jgi:AcrR family transcriptional regulator